MEYILELNQSSQLTLPKELLEDLNLKPGAKFAARITNGTLTIENLPFSAAEKGDSLKRTIETLQN